MTATDTYRTARILVVEDAPDVLSVLERTLSDNGYSVSTAGDGESGLDAALDRQPDLLILDIGLPRKDGYQVARELRSRAYTAPVLMLTARDTVPDKVEGLDAGADDYLREAIQLRRTAGPSARTAPSLGAPCRPGDDQGR